MQGALGSHAVANQMRRLFGPRGGAARRDGSVAADIDVFSGAETDFEGWASYRFAKKTGAQNTREDGDARASKKKVTGDGQTL